MATGIFDELLEDLERSFTKRVGKRLRQFGQDVGEAAQATADAIEGIDGPSETAQAIRDACEHNAVVQTTDGRAVCITCGKVTSE